MKKLSNGYEIPELCFGSGITQLYRYGNCGKKSEIKYWMRNFLKNRSQIKKDIGLVKAIDVAMKNGCNMFDTSRAYGGSEYVIGNQLKKYNRNDFFVVTKLCNSDQYKGDVRAALRKSLDELQMDYVDLYLMHWPVEGCFVENWKRMEELYQQGLCKAIGVCNFNIHHLEKLKKEIEIMPMVNQFECHPLFTQEDLRNYCKAHYIQTMAYTATARMDERLKKTALVQIGKKYNKTIAQVILKWHQQIGNIPVVNSYNPAHIIENIDINDFYLTQEEIDKISKININSRLRYDPDNCDFTQL